MTFQLPLTRYADEFDIPQGSLFYPCCGRDTWEPIRYFCDIADEFHFVDSHFLPRIPLMECIPGCRTMGRT